MTSEEFVKNVFKSKEDLLKSYFDSSEDSYVSSLIDSLDLNEGQNKILKEIIDGVLTDALYGLLLGIDGSASIGNIQESFKLFDEKNNELTGGEIEGYAWEYFHN
ncbi:hypothetical protein [Seonamhaeicola sp.]|uniref:hypothetical protein n=1 Tax=Seonamhaeicola sp. TaxID=1912245 RepID=UPI00261F4BCC|nr:hypothetical protein [Seonamhaeicola sp.]